MPLPRFLFPSSRRRPVALVLGGGGARGLAHIGLLQVLDDHELRPDMIVGTSIGAIVGAMYAQAGNSAGLQARMTDFLRGEFFTSMELEAFYRKRHSDLFPFIEEWMREIRLRLQLTRVLTQRGVIPRSVLTTGLGMLIDDDSIENFALPFACVAMDARSGEVRILRKGSAVGAVAASSSIPGIIEVEDLGTGYLIDGAVTAATPVREAREIGARSTVAVDVSPALLRDSLPDAAYEVMIRAGDIATAHCNRQQLEDADLVLRPAVGHLHWAQFDDVDSIIEAGRSEALQQLSRLRRFLAK
ncbi:MAG: patatin-like phospholipase family protein [Bacteroidota bacterium]|nr:patatin-like phospholipase family protein [Bacteroidota bacterium]